LNPRRAPASACSTALSIRVHEGDLFERPLATGRSRRSAMPSTDDAGAVPGKVLAVWNNFRALIEKMSLRVPAEPLYFIKSPNAYLDPGCDDQEARLRQPHHLRRRTRRS
jgi:2-keto-4-pentenoate hydratase/2-oxohepta-3-ene-1,7-dioic acid hydratase in catechol pathway